MEKIKKAVFKFNGGNLALLCSKCSVIIKEGRDFNNIELLCSKGLGELEACYCEKCTKKKK